MILRRRAVRLSKVLARGRWAVRKTLALTQPDHLRGHRGSKGTTGRLLKTDPTFRWTTANPWPRPFHLCLVQGVGGDRLDGIEPGMEAVSARIMRAIPAAQPTPLQE